MSERAVSRRVVLGGCVAGCGLALVPQPSAGETAEPARNELPQPGDQLVTAGADAGTTPLKPEDLEIQDLVLAWAFDPQKKIPRDGSRLNMILLMRFKPETLSQVEKDRAADGVVAYSAICTHAACTAQCPCHQSRYNLRDEAKVVGGPAPRPLPALPLKLQGGALQVAAPFTGRVGGELQPK
jgi:rieske iron-sulfur protein